MILSSGCPATFTSIFSFSLRSPCDFYLSFSFFRSPCEFYFYLLFFFRSPCDYHLYFFFSSQFALQSFLYFCFSQVALRFRQAGKREACQVGATIPYIICREKDSLPQNGAVAERARHIDEITPDGSWQPDIDYYLSQQVRTRGLGWRKSGLDKVGFKGCRVWTK
jgi:hypothetical protein